MAEELLLNTELTEESKDRAIHLARGNKVLQVDKYDYTNHYEAKKLRDCKASAHIPEWRKSPVLSDYNFVANSGSGITFSRKGNALTITATAAAAKNLDTEKTYSATGSAYEIDPDRAVICWYDRTGRYQAMAGYTGVGRDPVWAYIHFKVNIVEEKGSITVRKVVATGGHTSCRCGVDAGNFCGRQDMDGGQSDYHRQDRHRQVERPQNRCAVSYHRNQSSHRVHAADRAAVHGSIGQQQPRYYHHRL